MGLVFFGLSCALSLSMVAGIVWLNKYEHPTRVTIQYLFGASIVSIMLNAMGGVVTDSFTATLIRGLYFVEADWLMLIVLSYVYRYTGLRKMHVWAKAVMVGGCLVDTISMVANAWVGHVFYCEPIILPDGELLHKSVNIVSEGGISIYMVHLLWVYALAVLSVIMLLQVAFTTEKLYRIKYTGILWSFIGVLVANVVYRFIDIPIDLSPILYAILSVACAYFTLIYTSRGLMVKVLSLSVEDMQSGILCFDKEGKCLYANEMVKMLFGMREDLHVAETYFSNWVSGKVKEELREESWKEEYEIDGETHFFEVNFKFLLNDRGIQVGSFFSFADRTEAIRELEIQKYNATHDYLTDIYNRKQFFEITTKVLRERPDEKRIIACIDIKDFKLVNDLFGEEAGNQILKRIAGLMKRDASPSTIYGRLDADRFAMCMLEENFVEEKYAEYLDDLKKIINSSVFRMHGHVGVYHIVDPTVNVAVMCDKAFVAIQNVKDSYHQIVSHYTEDIGQEKQWEKVIIGEFDRALAAGEFQMFLQPQIAADGYHIIGAEALVRWEHPVRGMISPAEFIPVFEKSGYITRLDYYMWELACKQLCLWKEQGMEELHISVNISPADFYRMNLYDTFTSLVEQYGIKPSSLKLEITETALMEDISKHMQLLDRLREYGFQVEIDDFGSGYSSLNTLQDIEVDVLKLDMGFLRKTTHEKRSRTIMNSVIDMSKNLGLTVVTEGVETVEQVDYLTEAGCDIFQGYYFAKPMPVNEFEMRYLAQYSLTGGMQ